MSVSSARWLSAVSFPAPVDSRGVKWVVLTCDDVVHVKTVAAQPMHIFLCVCSILRVLFFVLLDLGGAGRCRVEGGEGGGGGGVQRERRRRRFFVKYRRANSRRLRCS